MEMDAEKWGNAYDRTLNSDGEDEALEMLHKGMIREMESRAHQAGRGTEPPDVIEEVDELYRDVARGRDSLNEEGFINFVQDKMPEFATENA